MKAIETIYNGYRFRSRLEARWAVFFDEMGIKYEYEPQGYKLSNGKCYLPDFYLPESKCFVEIKHDGAITEDDGRNENETMFCFNEQDGEKYVQFINEATEDGYLFFLLCGDPLECMGDSKTAVAKIFVLYECVIKNWEDIECHDCEKCNQGEGVLCIPFLGFTNDNKFVFFFEGQTSPFFPSDENVTYFKNIKEFYDMDKGFYKRHITAAAKARQARFEHGEKP